MGYKP